jgi:hypothetical protein
LTVEFHKKNTSQVTTDKFNQLTISKSLPAMTLQDSTSSINCMQDAAAQLDKITPFTIWLQRNHCGHDASHGAQTLLSSHVLQQDIQPEHQLLKSIA